MRVRVHRFLAGLTGQRGAVLGPENDSGKVVEFDLVGLDDTTNASQLRPHPHALPGDTFDARVFKVYGDHPTHPNKYELRVVREDTHEELYCPSTAVVSILPAAHVHPELTESARHRVIDNLMDAICGPCLDTEEDEEDLVPPPPPAHLHVQLGRGAPLGPDEFTVEL